MHACIYFNFSKILIIQAIKIKYSFIKLSNFFNTAPSAPITTGLSVEMEMSTKVIGLAVLSITEILSGYLALITRLQ